MLYQYSDDFLCQEASFMKLCDADLYIDCDVESDPDALSNQGKMQFVVGV